MEKDNSTWGHAFDDKLLDRWPKDRQGEPEEPVLLDTFNNLNAVDEMIKSMLEGYGIPCLRVYPGNGAFAKIVLGMSGQGTELYVPKSMYEDAVALCKEENNEEL